MDSDLCREHLAALLAEEVAALADLEKLLQQEHEMLVANDVDALERTSQERQERVGALVRLETERQSLCRMHGYSADLSGLEQLIAWCDPAGTLVSSWSVCAEKAARCRELNDRNGALVAARMKRVESLLSVLTSRSRQVATYDSQGAFSYARTGRMLGEA